MLSAGIDYLNKCTQFRQSPIQLTNVKGAFSEVLGEFIAMGMLYHTKKLESFMAKKVAHTWEKAKVDIVSDKTMVVVGFGDIGSACGKIAKHGFGVKVVGIKRRPANTPESYRANADEIVGLD